MRINIVDMRAWEVCNTRNVYGNLARFTVVVLYYNPFH